MRKINIAALGMESSGKTSWYDYLYNKNRNTLSTINEPLPDIEITCNQNCFILKDIKDIGGYESNIRGNYLNMIEKGDIILFFLDINKYLLDITYRRHTNARLDYIFIKLSINNNLRNNHIINSESSMVEKALWFGLLGGAALVSKNPLSIPKEKKIFIIMSHADLLEDRIKSEIEVNKIINERFSSYNNLIHSITLIDMNNQKELDDLKNNVFLV